MQHQLRAGASFFGIVFSIGDGDGGQNVTFKKAFAFLQRFSRKFLIRARENNSNYCNYINVLIVHLVVT